MIAHFISSVNTHFFQKFFLNPKGVNITFCITASLLSQQTAVFCRHLWFPGEVNRKTQKTVSVICTEISQKFVNIS